MALSTKTIMATDYNESTLEMARRKPLGWQKVCLYFAMVSGIMGQLGENKIRWIYV